MSRIYTEEKFEKIKQKLEEKITKAYYKGHERKFDALRLKFTKLFHKSSIWINAPEGQAFTTHIEFPEENTNDPVRFEIIKGHTYTKTEYDEKLRQEKLEQENQELTYIFGFGKEKDKNAAEQS